MGEDTNTDMSRNNSSNSNNNNNNSNNNKSRFTKKNTNSNKNKSNKIQSKTTKYKGKCDKLKDFIFDANKYNQADDYIKTLNEIAEYIGTEYDYGDDTRAAIE